MKVVVISGSPRKGANTQIMMEYLYNYAKTKNADTRFIDLSTGGENVFVGLEKTTTKVRNKQQKMLLRQMSGLLVLLFTIHF